MERSRNTRAACTACYDGKREVRIYDYADLNVPMLARMFDRRCRGYEAVGYTILLPASAVPGWPADVVASVRSGLETRLRRQRAPAHSRRRRHAAGEPVRPCRAAVAARRRGSQRAREARPKRSCIGAWKPCRRPSGRFRLNAALPIPFDGFGTLEVDLLCADARIAMELDGAQHLADPIAYRRDRRKDQLLQENGYLVLRFLAEDVGKELDAVLDAILRALSQRRTRVANAQ